MGLALSFHTKAATDIVGAKNERGEGLNLSNHNKSVIQPPALG